MWCQRLWKQLVCVVPMSHRNILDSHNRRHGLAGSAVEYTVSFFDPTESGISLVQGKASNDTTDGVVASQYKKHQINSTRKDFIISSKR